MRFTYTAQDKEGKEVRGELRAPTEKEAARMITQRGLLLLHIEVESDSLGAQQKTGIILNKNLSTFDQIIITRHLGTILDTGTDLLAGLSIIAKDAISPMVKRVMLDIKNRVSTGETFAQALSAWKDQFSPVLLNLVRAGEMSGNLAQVLSTYSQDLRKDYTFVRKVKGAMLYPAILISALTIMLMIILWVVIPRLKELFATTNVEPPFYTKLIFLASDIWVQHAILIVVLLILAIVGIIIGFRNKKMRRRFQKLLWRLPYLRNIQRNYALLRFSKTLSSLIQAGIPLENALKVTGEAIGGEYTQILADISDKSLSKGISLSEALRKHEKYFPGLLVSVIATGEQSGNTDVILGQMAEFYEEEVIYALEKFLIIIEPALIIVVGIIIGLMAGSLIAPIYKFIGRF